MIRVYDRSEPTREGTVVSTDDKAWTMRVDWDDGQSSDHDIDHLGHVPTTPSEIAAAKTGWLDDA